MQYIRCSNCGAKYDSNELRCPYCGLPTPKRNKQEEERKAVNTEINETQSHVKSAHTLVIADKISSWSLIILIGIIAIIIIVVAIVGIVQTEVPVLSFKFNQAKVESNMTELYNNKQYQELYLLMDKYDLISKDRYTYSQMCLVYDTYNNITQDKFDVIDASKELDKADEYDDWRLRYSIESLLDDSAELLSLNYFNYSKIAPKNVEDYEEYCNDTKAMLKYMFGLTDEEILALSNTGYSFNKDKGATSTVKEIPEDDYDYGSSAFINSDSLIVDKVIERGAWK